MAWESRPIFISSTFADMQAERDHLLRFVFPALEERLRARRRHLEWVLSAYMAHYNRARPHRGIGLGVPVAPDKVPVRTGPIERVDVLGGLIHEYHRAA